MPRGRPKVDKAAEAFNDLICALASNPEIYKGTLQDAAKLGRLAYEIIEEVAQTMEAHDARAIPSLEA